MKEFDSLGAWVDALRIHIEKVVDAKHWHRLEKN